MSIFEVKNNQLQRMDASDMAQLTATDTDDILGGGAGSEVNAQALLDGITGELGTLDSGKQPKTLSTPLTIDGASETTVEGALGGLNDYADDQEDEISAICNVYGSKNVLKVTSGSTSNFTVNADGSILGNTPTAPGSDLYFTFNGGTTLPQSGDYTFSGITGGSSSTYFMQIHDQTANTYKQLVDGEIKYTYTAGHVLRFQIVVKAGKMISNITFKPMIRDARINDDTYVPYVPTNRDLVSWTANSVQGVKNLFNIYTPSSYSGNLTKITSGVRLVATSAVNYANARYYVDLQKATNYRIKINAANIASGVNMVQIKGSADNVTFTLIMQFNGGTSYDGVFNSGNYNYYTVQLFYTGASGAIGDGVDYTNAMLWLAEDTDDTYQPYAMTNQGLTDMVVPVDITGQITWGSGITINASFTKVVRIGKEILFSAYFSYNTELAADTWKEICTLPVNCVSTFFSALTRFTDPVTGLIENNTKVKITSHNIAIPSGRMCCINTVFLIA